MQKVIQHQTNKLIIALPAIALAIFTALITNIYIGNSIANSHAILGSGEYQLSVQNNTTLSVELPATTPISVTPTVEGAFNSGNVTINVITDYVNGYTLTMSASTSSLSRSEAVSGVTYTIPSLTSSKDATDNPYTCTAETSATCNFPKNYWGLKRSTAKVTDAGYIPYIANTSMLINSTASAADESISNVDFGVKLSNATPNGTYNITLDFLAVTNVAPNLYYMQDATPSSLAAAMPSVGSTTTLYDRRDNQEYTVAKLADGKYWMTKNLNLAGGTPLYSSDSDVPAGYDAEPYYTLPNSSMDGFDNNGATYAYVYNSDNNTDNCDNGCYSYYSYNTATALSGTNIPAYTDAPYSICPKGWKLPTASPDINDNADLYQLAVAYGMNSNAASEVTATFYNNAGAGKTPNVLLNGFVRQSAFLNAPSEGDLWSATTGDVSDRALYMRVTGSYVDSAHNDARMYGFSVRCLFDDTMQSFSSDYAAAMSPNETLTLRDKRDNQFYNVTKINNRVWMTQNLAFAGTSLTPYNSNVATDTTMTYYDFTEATCYGETGYNVACIKTDSTYGAWYNYAAATAQTITSTNGLENAVYDICPTNWSLPSLAQQQEIINYQDNYNVIGGGIWYEGANSATSSGLWWSSTTGLVNYHRNFLIYNRFDDGILSTRDDGNLRAGYYVRCILK